MSAMFKKMTNTHELVTSQYKTSGNLRSRGNLHTLYNTNHIPWMAWLFDHFALQSGQRVLVCGGGPGMVWEANLDRIPADVEVVFTDVSPGMVAEAQKKLASAEMTFRIMDVSDIPYEDDSFDLVTANHMLYHVPDIPKALFEIQRVLKPMGKLVAATNGTQHMPEIHQLRRTLAPNSYQIGNGWSKLSFRLENGEDLLRPHFGRIEQHAYPDSLAVTDFEPLLAYATSTPAINHDDISAETRQAARQQFDAAMATHGAYHIQKDVGVFIAS